MTIYLTDQWTVQQHKHKDRRVTFVDWQLQSTYFLQDQPRYSEPFFVVGDEVSLTIDRKGSLAINFIPDSSQTLALYLKTQKNAPAFTKVDSWHHRYTVSIKVTLGKHDMIYSKVFPVTFSCNVIKKIISIGAGFSQKELSRCGIVRISLIFMSEEMECIEDSLREVKSPHSVLRTLVKKFPKGITKHQARSRKANAGLINPSNLCFLNSVIQVLYNNVSFTEFIFGLQTTEGGTHTTVPQPKPSSILSFELQKLFYAMHTSVSSDIISCTSLAINGLKWSMKDLDEQQDASEILITLLDKLREENPKFQDFLDEIMTLSLEEVSVFLSGSKEVLREKSESVMPINIFDHSNLVSELNAVFGKARKGTTPLGEADIYTRIAHCPKTLSFSLNRYEYKAGELVKSNKKFTIPKKLNIFDYSSEAMIFMPETPRRNSAHPTLSVSGTMARELRNQLSALLSVRNQDSSNEIYYLAGVITHSGSSTFGHYQSHINYFEKIDEDSKIDIKANTLFSIDGVSYKSNWITYNDSSVSPIAEKELLDIISGGQKLDASEEFFQNSAYLLFYLRFSEVKQLVSGMNSSVVTINPILQSAISAAFVSTLDNISKELESKLYASIKVATPFSLHGKSGLGYLPINMLNNKNKLKISGLLITAKLSHYQALSHLTPLIKEDLAKFYKQTQKQNSTLLKAFKFDCEEVNYDKYDLQLRKFNVRKNGTVRPSQALKENVLNQDIKTATLWRADVAQYCIFASLCDPKVDPSAQSLILIKGVFARSLDQASKSSLRVIGFLNVDKAATFKQILPEIVKLYFLELVALDVPLKKLNKFITNYVASSKFSLYEEISPLKLGAIDMNATVIASQVRDGDILVVNPISELSTADLYSKLNEKVQVRLLQVNSIDDIDSVVGDPIVLDLDRNVMIGSLAHEITKITNSAGAVIYKPAFHDGAVCLRMIRSKNTLGVLLKELRELAVFDNCVDQEKISVSSTSMVLYFMFDPLANIHTEVKFSWIGLNEPLPIYDAVSRIDPQISVTDLFDLVRAELFLEDDPAIQLYFLSIDESRIVKILNENEEEFRLDIALMNVSHILVSMAVAPHLYTFILHNVDPLNNKCFKYPLVLPLKHSATIEDVRQAILAKYALARQRRAFESSVDPKYGLKLSGKEATKLSFAFSIGPTITSRHFYHLPKLRDVEQWPIVMFNRVDRKIVPFASTVIKESLSRDNVLCVLRGKE